MPTPRERTLDEYDAREERRRAQWRQSSKRYRERQHDGEARQQGADGAVSMTHDPGAVPRQRDAVSPPQTPPSPSISKEIEKIKTLLEPFTARGYEHDPAFWELMAAQYPQVALRVEAYNMASWLKKPLKKNRDALCNTGFIINWLKKAQADAGTPRALPYGQSPPTTSVYHGQNGQRVDPPIAFQPNRQPPDDGVPLPAGGLVPIAKEEFQRTVEANRGLPLGQKLARLNGRLKGGTK